MDCVTGFPDKKDKKGIMADTLIPAALKRQRKVALYEFGASLIYIVIQAKPRLHSETMSQQTNKQTPKAFKI